MYNKKDINIYVTLDYTFQEEDNYKYKQEKLIL